jgi:hypothetical protein
MMNMGRWIYIAENALDTQGQTFINHINEWDKDEI